MSSSQLKASYTYQSPRWKSKEFMVYYVLFAALAFKLFKSAWDMSNSWHPGFYRYQRALSKGWMFGRAMDLSDAQYSGFRSNLPSLVPLFAAFVIISHMVQRSHSFLSNSTKLVSPSTWRIFSAASSFVILLAIHGVGLFKMMIILFINYAIAKRCKGSLANAILTWTFNIAVLIASDRTRGFAIGPWMPALSFLDTSPYTGFQPRWYITFNFSVLRLISFNMDYYFFRGRSPSSSSTNPANPYEMLTRTEQEASRRSGDNGANTVYNRTKEVFHIHEAPRRDEFGFLNCFCYVFYLPLYFAGPIVTFNNFMFQTSQKRHVSLPQVLRYGLRHIALFLFMEFMLHTCYAQIIIKAHPNFTLYTPLEVISLGYFNLTFVWLKLTCIWRFFHLVALADGIWPPENQLRCMSNNYSVSSFWRAWHKSYSLWIIRYIYVPLGGSSHFLKNVWPVYTFVAIWHDVELRLLYWGWLIALFMVPEAISKKLFPESKVVHQWGFKTDFYRHLCAFGASFNAVMMILANLVGFVLGGNAFLLFQIMFSSLSGIITSSLSFFSVYIAVHFMFEIREEEKRRGIFRNY